MKSRLEKVGPLPRSAADAAAAEIDSETLRPLSPLLAYFCLFAALFPSSGALFLLLLLSAHSSSVNPPAIHRFSRRKAAAAAQSAPQIRRKKEADLSRFPFLQVDAT